MKSFLCRLRILLVELREEFFGVVCVGCERRVTLRVADLDRWGFGTCAGGDGARWICPDCQEPSERVGAWTS